MSNERARHFFEPSGTDYERAKRLQTRMEAASLAEVVRRSLITTEAFLDVQDNGGQIVICQQGKPDRVVWLL